MPHCQPSATSATPATQMEGRCHQVPRLPQKRRWMSRSATPAMPSGAVPRATQRAEARHQSQPSAISGTPATRSEGGCATPAEVPHRRPSAPKRAQARPSAPKRPTQCHKPRLPQNEGGCHQVPRLPREAKLDVTKCHAACHTKYRRVTGDQVCPSAPKRGQARHQSQPGAISATPATQNEGGCHQVPRLPRKTKVDVTKCHACHAKRRWMSTSATPATQSIAHRRPSAQTCPSAPPEPVQCHT